VKLIAYLGDSCSIFEMAKWADYLISQVSYDQNHLITKVKRHRDNGNTISEGEVIDRNIVADNLGHGTSYMTIYSALGKIRIGKNVRYFRAYEHHYIRVDNNKVSSDNLDDLPQLDESKQEEKPALPKTKPAVETKPLSALSSAFFAEQVEKEPEPAAVEAEVTPEPAAVEAEVTPEPAAVEAELVQKESKKKIMKTKSSAKKKASVKKKPAKKKASVKKKPAKKKASVKKKPAKKKASVKKKRS
jgi:chemotaxis protein histidine kinase CheA